MTHIDRTRCRACGEWYWAGDLHACAGSDVLSAAFPTHDRMVTTIADAQASRAAQAYRARIADENEYWAGLYGLVLTGRAA